MFAYGIRDSHKWDWPEVARFLPGDFDTASIVLYRY
jgi:hypothetical protein